jgi:YVTN family beta-propeller protein
MSHGLRLTAVLFAGTVAAAQNFVHWESPHVSPLALTPDKTRLLAVNTADDRLEVFDVTGILPQRLEAVQVGLDPVSVRARSNTEAWVVNHVSDTVSVVDLVTGRVRATLDTDDEPCDVVLAGTPERAFVSCSQANTVLVFDPTNLAAAPVRLTILGEDPRMLAVSPDGSKVYAAIFESGNGSTVLGGGGMANIGFPPNVVSDPTGPYGGVNPPPNSGTSFVPPKNPSTPIAPKVSLIVKKNDLGQWMDDNAHDWTDLVSGPNAAKSGRPVGWDLYDHDLAVIDTGSLAVSYVPRLMNVNMALAVNPASGEITTVGTDGTNELRFEPNLTGKFLRVWFARASSSALLGKADLNAHLNYSQSQIPQSEREKSLGDPRAILWNATGTRAFVAGMGSSNLIVVDPLGARVGLAPTIEVGEGPTGLALDETKQRLYVLAKFEGAISVVTTASELEIARVKFFDPTPVAAKLGRRHLYDTHANSGLGHIACASCHVDARFDRLAWDLGDPSGNTKSVAGSNLGGNVPGLNTGFQPWHPMKGPMTTQTLQDVVGREPLHWRGDRFGLEEFNPAFVGLQGRPSQLTPQEMQEFENFLATIYYPPNPYRNLDNSLPTNLPLPGHFTTGRFGPPGLPLPNGDAQAGLTVYRPPNLLDGGTLACSTCHTMPTGMGTDWRFQGGVFVPIAPGPNGERHHALVSVDGVTNISMKTPQLRNLYDKVGFEMTQQQNRAGFGFLHDGSVDSIARFVNEPVFNVTSDQMTADLVAFMLCFSGGDLPVGQTNNPLEPPSTIGKDTHAAVGTQTTLADSAAAPPAQLALIDSLRQMALANKIGLVVKGRVAGLARGWQYVSASNTYQSDRVSEVHTPAQLLALAAPGSELTYTAVPKGSELRLGLDRDEDGYFDRDEIDLGTDPADPDSVPGGCMQTPPSPPRNLAAAVFGTQINLSWTDLSPNETAFAIERSLKGANAWVLLSTQPADVTAYPDTTAACGQSYDYRVSSSNCAGSIGWAYATANAPACCPSPTNFCVSTPNSTGQACLISSSGSTSVAANDLVLHGAGAVPNVPCLFIYAPAQAQTPLGNGFLCLDGGGIGIFRLVPPLLTDGSGSVSLALDVNAPPDPSGQITAGSTWNFQLWYRDPTGSPATFNLSDGLNAQFCP